MVNNIKLNQLSFCFQIAIDVKTIIIGHVLNNKSDQLAIIIFFTL